MFQIFMGLDTRKESKGEVMTGEEKKSHDG